MGDDKPWEFTPDPNDGRCAEWQERDAYYERYGQLPNYNIQTGQILRRIPVDCVTSSEQFRYVSFCQFDEPRVSNAKFATNLIGRTGSIKYHLSSLDNGKVYANADYIDLDDDLNDPLRDYVESGKDDGGLFWFLRVL